MTSALRSRVLAAVQPERLGRLGYDLCRIQSYTGETREATELFIAEARASGLEIERFDDFPTTPAVVARLRGRGGGPALELNAHVDTIPLAHRPARLENGILSGRGATDMKGPLAACLEVARAIQDAGVVLRGDLLVTTNGRHEAPAGHGEDLIARLERGVHGDAAIVAELGSDDLPVIGLGLAIFTVRLSRDGEVTHETSTPAGTPNPLIGAARLVGLFEELGQSLTARALPYVGSESIFLGELHGGDFFNRFPTHARIVGTRRWLPDNQAAPAEAEMVALCRRVADEFGLSVELDFAPVREGFRIDETAPIVEIIRRVYREVNGSDLPLAGIKTVADVPVFTRVAGIPALYHGARGRGHHGDLEEMPVAELTRLAREFALVALDFCSTSEEE